MHIEMNKVAECNPALVRQGSLYVAYTIIFKLTKCTGAIILFLDFYTCTLICNLKL